MRIVLSVVHEPQLHITATRYGIAFTDDTAFVGARVMLRTCGGGEMSNTRRLLGVESWTDQTPARDPSRSLALPINCVAEKRRKERTGMLVFVPQEQLCPSFQSCRQ